MTFVCICTAGMALGLSSAFGLFALREYAFRPPIPVGPEVPVGASFMQLVSHAGMCKPTTSYNSIVYSAHSAEYDSRQHFQCPVLAVHSMAHTVRNFPYRFRLISVMASGALGGAVSVYGQKLYAQRWLEPTKVEIVAPPVVVDEPPPPPPPAPVEARVILSKPVPEGLCSR